MLGIRSSVSQMPEKSSINELYSHILDFFMTEVLTCVLIIFSMCPYIYNYIYNTYMCTYAYK